MEPQSLSDRVRELALDAEVEREALERRKAELLTEREAKVAEVREEYRVKLDEVEASLALADRLRKALDPEGAKRAAAEKRARRAAERASKNRPGAPSQKWRPSPEAFASVLDAISKGAQTVREIADSPGVGISSTTVKLAIDYAREDGWLRLAGTDSRNAKLYRITPQGTEHLESLSMRNGGTTVGANA